MNPATATSESDATEHNNTFESITAKIDSLNSALQDPVKHHLELTIAIDPQDILNLSQPQVGKIYKQLSHVYALPPPAPNRSYKDIIKLLFDGHYLESDEENPHDFTFAMSGESRFDHTNGGYKESVICCSLM